MKKEDVIGKYFLKDAMIYGLGNAFSKIASLLLVPILTRVFNPSEYGVIELILTSVSAMTIVISCNLDSATARYYYENNDYEYRKQLLSTNLILLILISVPAIYILTKISGRLTYLIFNNLKYESLLLLALITIPLNIIKNHFFIVLRLLRNAYGYVILTTIDAFGSMMLTYIMITKFDLGIISVFYSTVFVSVTIILIEYIMLAKYYNIFLSKPLVIKFVKYSLPMMPGLAAMWALDYSNRVMIQRWVGEYEVGIYGLAFRISSIVGLFLYAFRMAWDPIALSIMKQSNAKEIYAKTLTVYLFLIVSLALGVSVFSKEIILLVSSSKYLNASDFVGILSGSIILQGVVVIMTIGISISEKTHILSLAYILGAIITILFNIMTIKIFGMLGASLSTIVGYVVIVLSMQRMSKCCYPIPWETNKTLILGIVYVLVMCIGISIDNYMSCLNILSKLLLLIVAYYLSFYVVIGKNGMSYFKYNLCNTASN